MKPAELRKKNREDLEKLLFDELHAQFNLRMQKGSSQLSKPSEIKKTRRNIARIKTIMKQGKID